MKIKVNKKITVAMIAGILAACVSLGYIEQETAANIIQLIMGVL